MISVVIKPDVIELPAGAVVRVPGTWQDYQALAAQLGDHASPRLKYRNGELLLMVPLPEPGKQLDIMVDMVKVLLRHQGLRFDSYHETTIVSPGQSGIVPDHFFYIGELPVVGKRRIDWDTEPPPDLAIECDVTPFTSVDDYLPYRVGELWILRQQIIAIYQLQGDRYAAVQQSRFFADFDLSALYLNCIQAAYQFGSEAGVAEFRYDLPPSPPNFGGNPASKSPKIGGFRGQSQDYYHNIHTLIQQRPEAIDRLSDRFPPQRRQ